MSQLGKAVAPCFALSVVVVAVLKARKQGESTNAGRRRRPRLRRHHTNAKRRTPGLIELPDEDGSNPDLIFLSRSDVEHLIEFLISRRETCPSTSDEDPR